MDGNKDEALRCVRIAEEAIATGNKTRALKFIRIAQRLNNNLPIDALLSMCDRLDSQSSASSSSSSSSEGKGKGKNRVSSVIDEGLNGNKNYTDENVKLVREIKLKSDYYAILGVEKSCSVEEIRKAYRKLSLKVHPDKNKAPGSEEAFKKVSKAFKCLSDDGSRRQYDQTGLVDEFEYNQQYNVPRRRRRAAATARDFFEEDFDPEEIFRAFFGQSDVFGRAHVYRTRGTRQEFRGGSGGGGGGGGGGGLNIMLLVQLLPFLIIMLVAYLPFSEPEYSLLKNYSYRFPKTTENYRVQFFVKSDAFDHDYPQGSPARAKVEDSVIKDYRNMLRRYCQIELQRRSWNRNLPTPHCEKLQTFDVEA